MLSFEARQRLKTLLIKHEGLRIAPYKDSLGKLTIGVGRCLDTKGISQEEAIYLMNNDIQEVYSKLTGYFDWFMELDENRQVALIDMAYNLGVGGLMNFHALLAHMEKKEYSAAAQEMLNSVWCEQVKGRAQELANIIKTGEL